jgi:hypothetical protein
METQQRQLEELVVRDGWTIVARELSSAEWWLDEVWILESTWTPAGVRVFLSFLVDPQAPGERRKVGTMSGRSSPHRPASPLACTRNQTCRSGRTGSAGDEMRSWRSFEA